MVLINTFVNGTLANADDINQNFKGVGWNKVVYMGTNRFNSLMPHSTTAMSACLTTGGVYSTADAGLDGWTVRDALPDVDVFSRLCKDDKTRGFLVERTGNFETSYSTGADGVTWAPGAVATFGSNVNDLSFPTLNWLVVFGDDTAGTDHIIYSVNQGTAFANSGTSPAAQAVCGDCYSGTGGYAVVAGVVWKCVNGGAGANDWITTGHTCTAASTHSAMAAFSETAVVIVSMASPAMYVHTYDNAGNATKTLQIDHANLCLGCVHDSNGIFYTGCRTTATGEAIMLFRSRDSGATWDMINISAVDVPTINQITQKCSLAVDADDNLYLTLAEQRMIYKFDGI